MITEYITIDSIIARLSIGNNVKIPIGDIIEYTGQVLDSLNSPAVLDNSVIFLAVYNHKATLPPGVIDIVQVAKYKYEGTLKSLLSPKNSEDKLNSSDVCPKTIYNQINQESSESKPCCSCYKEPTLKIETVPLAIRYYEIGNIIHDSWFCTGHYKTKFTPVHRTTNTMFNVLDCVDNSINTEFRGYQYSVKAPNLIFSFSEGIVAISANRLKLDKKGFPLIPKSEYLERAISSYCKWRYYEDMLAVSFTNQYRYLAEKNEADYKTNYSYALSEFKSKGLIDTLENLYRSSDSLIPNNYSYSNLFSDFGVYER